MNTFIYGLRSNTSMSEKKSSIQNEKSICSVCRVDTGDFLELFDNSDSGFILCANCEAMSECKDLYGAYNIGYIDARSREGVSYYCPNPRITETIASKQTLQRSEEVNAK